MVSVAFFTFDVEEKRKQRYASQDPSMIIQAWTKERHSCLIKIAKDVGSGWDGSLIIGIL